MLDLDLPNLVFLALAGLLVLVRFDAQRFGAAEYDDEDSKGGWRDDLRRLTWYALGLALITAIYLIHPRPVSTFRLTFGDDRAVVVAAGLLLGSLGTAIAVSFAAYRYGRFRLPSPANYPGAVLNSVGTAFIDEATFRGVVFGGALALGVPLWLAIVFQALLYGLSTRLTAPGRSKAMLAIFVLVGIVAAWVTWRTGGIAAAFLGHAITRFAFFVCTGHAGQIEVPGYEPEERAGQDLPPKGWHVVDEHGRRRWVEAGPRALNVSAEPGQLALAAGDAAAAARASGRGAEGRTGTVTRGEIDRWTGADRRSAAQPFPGAERRVSAQPPAGVERRATNASPRADRQPGGQPAAGMDRRPQPEA